MGLGRCEIPRCRAEAALSYLGHGVCNKHWNELSAEDAPPEALRMALRMKATDPAMETTMPEPTTTEKTTKKAAATKSGAAGKTVKVTKVKAAKEAKPKKEKPAPHEPLCIFAFRLTEADRETIHKAAGPARASKFVLAAALAAANGDTRAFETLVTQAKVNTK